MKNVFGSNHLRLLVGTLLLVVTMAALAPGNGQTIAEGAKPAAPRGTNLLYFPLVQKPASGIFGRVTFNGSPIAGVSLELVLFNGSSYSTSKTTSTAADGTYLFTGVPSLASGQKYFVGFQNTTVELSRLSFWATRTISSYVPGDSVGIGDFDIANISLVAPAPYATVALPYAFQWTRRPATPSDSYELDLEGTTGSPYWYTSPTLGYVSSYTLNSLPAGFSPNVPYEWYVMVTDSHGGWGSSYYYRDVTFSNSGHYPSAPESVAPTRDPAFVYRGLNAGWGRVQPEQ